MPVYSTSSFSALPEAITTLILAFTMEDWQNFLALSRKSCVGVCGSLVFVFFLVKMADDDAG